MWNNLRNSQPPQIKKHRTSRSEALLFIPHVVRRHAQVSTCRQTYEQVILAAVNEQGGYRKEWNPPEI